MNSTLTPIALALLLPILALPCAAKTGGEPAHLEPGLAGRTDIVFHGGFEADAPGSPEWTRSWGAAFTSRISAATLTDGAAAGSRALRVDYPKGGVGPSETGVQFPVDFSRIEGVPALHDSLHFRYYVFFEPGFDFVKGGKLPGLMGGGGSWARSGGDQPDGTNGWTMRFMWRRDGEAVVYAYLPPGKYRKGVWGTDIPLGRRFTTGRWICIEQYVRVNTPGRDDGTLVVWLDGEEVLRLGDVNYRTVDNPAGRIGGFYVSTFHGGNTPDWGPSHTSFARFDGFVAARERVGPTAPAPKE